MDQKLMEQAAAIRDEQQEAANTNVRVGGLLVSILQVLGQTLTADNLSWRASATGVDLRFTVPSADGQTADQVVDLSVPCLSDAAAGVMTPAQAAAIRQAAADLVKAEKDERRTAVENLQSTLSSVIQTANAAQTAAQSATATASAASTAASAATAKAEESLAASTSAASQSAEALTLAQTASGDAAAAKEQAESAADASAAAKGTAASALSAATAAAEAVVPFGMIRQGIEDYAEGIYTGMVNTAYVLFDAARRAFAYWQQGTQQGGVYYKYFSGSERWQKDGVPHTGKLFVSGGTSYRFVEGQGLVEVGSTLRLGTESTEAFPGDRGQALEYRMDNLTLPTVYNVTNEQPLSEGLFYTLASATAATWAKGKAADGLIISFAINEKQWKTYQFTASLTGTDSERKAIFCAASSWQDFGSLSAGTEPVININNLCGEPDAGAYYTLSTAIAKLLAYQRSSQVVYAKPGLIIAYRTAATEMECKQFCGTQQMVDGTDSEGRTFGTLDLWKDFGGGGKLAALLLGDTPLEADEKGSVTIPVDNSLSAESRNLVPNSVVSEAISRLQTNTLFSAETEESGAETTVTLKNQDGGDICSFSVPRGGGSSEDTGKGSISIAAMLDKQVLKLRDTLKLTYAYDHLTDGQTDGQTADIVVQMKIGTATVFSTTVKGVTPGTKANQLRAAHKCSFQQPRQGTLPRGPRWRHGRAPLSVAICGSSCCKTVMGRVCKFAAATKLFIIFTYTELTRIMTRKKKCSIGRVLKRDYATKVFSFVCPARAKRKLHDLIKDDEELLQCMMAAGWSDSSLWLTLREQDILRQHGLGCPAEMTRLR